MNVVLACDVDPVLPHVLSCPSRDEIWKCLDLLDDLMDAAGAEIPPITWLIRSDESVRFASGDFASGYLAKKPLWKSLQSRGHELGWHMHLLSFDASSGCFEFDQAPAWLAEAHRALAVHFDVRATRTGWDYADNMLFEKFESFGIRVDLSALPGNIVWQKAGTRRFVVDWLRCAAEPYHPSTDDYQRTGNLDLLEIPITQFSNTAAGIVKRALWRSRNGCWAFGGIANKTKLLTDRWDRLPTQRSDRRVWAFYFHPEDLSDAGLRNFQHNLRLLKELPDVQFLTATAARDALLAHC